MSILTRCVYSIVVALDTKVIVYSFAANPVQLQAFVTAENSCGVLAVSSSTENALAAFPGPEPGQVHVVDLGLGHGAPILIAAHESALAFTTFSRDGRLIATASTTGTLVRVFHTNSGRKGWELRRGGRAANIRRFFFCRWRGVYSNQTWPQTGWKLTTLFMQYRLQ